MTNPIDTLPGARAATLAAAGSGEATAAQTDAQTADAVASDSVAPSQAAAFAYAAFVAPERASRNAAAGDSWAADADSDGADELERRFGSALGVVRAALPPAVQGQFAAQLAAYAAPGGDPAVDEGNVARAGDDAALVARGGLLPEDQATLCAAVTRLARTVARHGAAAVATALHAREQDEERPRREPPAEPDGRDPQADSAQARRRQPDAYTIQDIIAFGGATIAAHRIDLRSSPWPS